MTRIIDRPEGLSVLLESFAFKRGVPTDSDFVFDARALPNPYWQTELRGMTGLDAPVIQFLDNGLLIRLRLVNNKQEIGLS